MIYIYFIIINIITFLIYGMDKLKAKKGKWRIPEVTLLLLAVVGGGLGAWFGIKIWHHKTMHAKFRCGVPLIIFVQLICIYFLVYHLNV